MRNIPTVKYTTVEGQEVINLLNPDNNRQAAIIDFSTLQRMTNLLNVADVYTIRERFMDRLRSDAHDFEAYLKTLEDELTFHKTVQHIRTIEVENFEETLNLGQ